MNENRKRVTMHNGRSHRGTGTAFSAKHNDRQFDVSQSDHIDPERSQGNRYWRWNQQDTPEQSFEDCEQEFYEHTFADYLQAQNQRHIDNRHPNRVKTMEQYRQSRLGRPEQVIMEIGNSKTGAPDPDTLWTIIKAQLDWEKKTFPAVRVLDIALHVDEPDSAPHIHVSRVWIAHDRDGHQMQQQEGALREMGVQKPLPESIENRDRYNNRKMTYTQACREHLQELCREHGLDIETEPQEKSQTGRTLLKVKADTLTQNIKTLKKQQYVQDYKLTQERLYAQQDMIDLAKEADCILEHIAQLKFDIAVLEHEKQEQLQELQEQIAHQQMRLQMITQQADKKYRTLRDITGQIHTAQQDLQTLQKYLDYAQHEHAIEIYRRYDDEPER